MYGDTIHYQEKTHHVNMEKAVRDFLGSGGKTGFVRGTDTHEGKPAARTAVLAKDLTRDAIFDALRHRRNYAVSNARIVLSFKIDGHDMGEEIQTAAKPRIPVHVQGTDKIKEVAIVRNGLVHRSVNPDDQQVKFEHVDRSFDASAYYCLRVIQADKDEHGNLSHAWSSPIGVRSRE